MAAVTHAEPPSHAPVCTAGDSPSPAGPAIRAICWALGPRRAGIYLWQQHSRACGTVLRAGRTVRLVLVFGAFLLVHSPFVIVRMLMFGIAATRRALTGITIVSTTYMLV